MGGLFSSGIGNKDLTTQNQNTSNWTSNSDDMGAGDGDNIIARDSDVQITNNTTDGGAFNSASYLASQAMGVAVNGQTLQVMLGQLTGATVDNANNNLAGGLVAGFNAFTRATDNTLQRAIDTAAANQKSSNALALQMSETAITQARQAAQAAANVAADAIASNQRATANALGFADSALISLTQGQGKAFTFAGDALQSSLNTAGRAMSVAENALDSSLSFARLKDVTSTNFLEGILGSVISLVKTTAANAQGEAQATREFAGTFVGDFYESQKSGDVQTIQNTVKYAAVVAMVVAAAWAVRAK